MNSWYHTGCYYISSDWSRADALVATPRGIYRETAQHTQVVGAELDAVPMRANIVKIEASDVPYMERVFTIEGTQEKPVILLKERIDEHHKHNPKVGVLPTLANGDGTKFHRDGIHKGSRIGSPWSNGYASFLYAPKESLIQMARAGCDLLQMAFTHVWQQYSDHEPSWSNYITDGLGPWFAHILEAPVGAYIGMRVSPDIFRVHSQCAPMTGVGVDSSIEHPIMEMCNLYDVSMSDPERDIRPNYTAASGVGTPCYCSIHSGQIKCSVDVVLRVACLEGYKYNYTDMMSIASVTRLEDGGEILQLR